MTLFRKSPFYIQVLCLALIFSVASAAERKKWETLSNCQYVAKEHNDGDSFRVKCSSREFVLRLYYVDAPDLSELLERLLGRRVEIVTTESLSPHLGAYILSEARDAIRAA